MKEKLPRNKERIINRIARATVYCYLHYTDMFFARPNLIKYHKTFVDSIEYKLNRRLDGKKLTKDELSKLSDEDCLYFLKNVKASRIYLACEVPDLQYLRCEPNPNFSRTDIVNITYEPLIKCIIVKFLDSDIINFNKFVKEFDNKFTDRTFQFCGRQQTKNFNGEVITGYKNVASVLVKRLNSASRKKNQQTIEELKPITIY